MVDFDPNAPAPKDSGIFGLPYDESSAALVLLPVAWEATTSYGGGTSKAPSAILQASRQVDLYDLDVETPYKQGICLLDEEPSVHAWNEEAKTAAQEVITRFGELEEEEEACLLGKVNQLGTHLNEYVRLQTARLLKSGKIVGVVGGDHSVPLGAFEATAAHHGAFGILHFDAHSDTRNAYEGFTFSHASIMYNALTRIPQLEKLVQVGIRDVCEQEMTFCAAEGERVRTFTDRELTRRIHAGENFLAVAREIVSSLPKKVWISFDIDGLDPRFCPHTGTPVPGGLDLAQAITIVRELASSGRTIVGFDLNEVAPNQADEADEWDANVAARLLYKLCGFTLASQGRANLLA